MNKDSGTGHRQKETVNLCFELCLLAESVGETVDVPDNAPLRRGHISHF